MTKRQDELPFIRTMSTFQFMVPQPRPSPIAEVTYDTKQIKHLLHLLHILCCPKQPTSKGSTEDSNKDEISNRIRSVEELCEVGVKFKKFDKFKTDTPNLFDIQFDKGLMKIPCFKVEDSTDAFFRNLIAFKQHSSDVYPRYFTDFTSLMNQLIDSEKDVKLLCYKGIIMNCLGDDKDVSDIFNKLGEGLLVSSKNYYAEVRRKVNKHRNELKYRLMAKLRHDYFNNPWASVSTIAAAVLLLLTLPQTIATLKAM